MSRSQAPVTSESLLAKSGRAPARDLYVGEPAMPDAHPSQATNRLTRNGCRLDGRRRLPLPDLDGDPVALAHVSCASFWRDEKVAGKPPYRELMSLSRRKTH
jgi:hypothetical protein